MAAYAVVNFDILDRSWVREYVKNASKIVARHGGKYLASTTEFEQIEGDCDPDLIVLLEFPSMDDLRGFYDDPDYRPLRDARKAGTKGDFYFVPGTPAA